MCSWDQKQRSISFLERIHALRNKVTHSLVALTNLYAYQQQKLFHFAQQTIHSQNNVKKRRKTTLSKMDMYVHIQQQQQFGSCDFRKVGFHICFILIIDMNAFAHSCLRAQYDHSIIKFHPEFTTFRFCFCFLPYIFVYLHFVVHV